MKSEIELLDQLRRSLEGFAESQLQLVRIDARDFKLVDQQFYERKNLELINLGFNPVGDFSVVTGHPSDSQMRCFLRALIAHDGCCVAALYHPRPKFWMGLLARLLSGRLGKIVEFETELSDDTIIATTTCPRTRLFDPPPLLLREHFPEVTPIDALLKFHRHRLDRFLKKHPGISIRKVYGEAGLLRMQKRDHDIKTVYRGMVGGLTTEEIRRFTIFGREQAQQIKISLGELSGS